MWYRKLMGPSAEDANMQPLNHFAPLLPQSPHRAVDPVLFSGQQAQNLAYGGVDIVNDNIDSISYQAESIRQVPNIDLATLRQVWDGNAVGTSANTFSYSLTPANEFIVSDVEGEALESNVAYLHRNGLRLRNGGIEKIIP